MERALYFLAWGLGVTLASGCGGASAGAGGDPAREGPYEAREAPPASRCEVNKARRRKEDPDAPLAGIPRFSAPMTPPVLMSMVEVIYTKEAYNARAQGIARARCVITELGVVSECTILKAPAGLEEAVAAAFQQMKYSPATRNGIPIAVDYPIELNVTLPSAPPQPPVMPPVTPPLSTPIPFGKGMERPKLLAGRDPVYSVAAREACVEGLLITRCTITIEGAITNCRVLKSLPYMDQSVVSALRSRTYTPVIYQGKPVAVDYVFNTKLVLPRR